MDITITELSEKTGFRVDHLVQLIRRGILPAGRKEGKCRYVPLAECLNILKDHAPGSRWKGEKKKSLSWDNFR